MVMVRKPAFHHDLGADCGIRHQRIAVKCLLDQFRRAIRIEVIECRVTGSCSKAGMFPNVEQTIAIMVRIGGTKYVDGAFVGLRRIASRCAND